MKPALLNKLRDGIAVAAIVVMMGIVLRSAIAASGDRSQVCTNNIYKLTVALRGYTQDYDEMLPQMNDIAAVGQLLGPYISQNQGVVAATLRCPATKNTLYVPNADLSGKSLAAFDDFSVIETFQDGKAHPDGRITIAYLDLTVLRGDREQQPADGVNICVRHVRAVTFGFLAYAQDHDENLPIFNNNADVETALSPYVRNSRSFHCPETLAPYNFNLALSGTSLAQFPDYSAVEVVRDSISHTDNTVTIGYLDGYVQRGAVPEKGYETQCLSRAKLLSQSVLRYVQDNDDALPPMNSFAAFKNALTPAYGKAGRIFYCPETKLNFVPNSALNGLKFSQIDSPASTILFKEPKAHKKDGKITVGYCDGHAARILP